MPSEGGERPRTSAYNSEILQSESLAEVSCPVSSKIDPFPGRPNSHISNDAYKLKVEKMKTDVLGRAGGRGWNPPPSESPQLRSSYSGL